MAAEITPTPLGSLIGNQYVPEIDFLKIEQDKIDLNKILAIISAGCVPTGGYVTFIAKTVFEERYCNKT